MVWRIHPEPDLTIGEAEGNPSYQFADIQGAVRMDDGRIVVADAGNYVLRFYNPNGKIIHSVGRQGQGPGEYESLAWIGACGDRTVYAWDFVLDRISIIDMHGEFQRSFKLSESAAITSAIGMRCHKDGTLVVASRVIGAPAALGPHRVKSSIHLLDAHGRIVQDLGEYPGMDRYRYDSSDGPQPFGKETAYAIGDHVVYVGTADEYMIQALPVEGTSATQIGRNVERRPITRRDQTRYIEQRLSRIKDRSQRERVAQNLRSIQFPDHFPAYRSFIVDQLNNLWVEQYRTPTDDAPRWDVFGPDGMFLGTLTAPAGLEVYQVGAGFILGKWSDPLDVGFIHLHRIER
jgi:hypothetical protein